MSATLFLFLSSVLARRTPLLRPRFALRFLWTANHQFEMRDEVKNERYDHRHRDPAVNLIPAALVHAEQNSRRSRGNLIYADARFLLFRALRFRGGRVGIFVGIVLNFVASRNIKTTVEDDEVEVVGAKNDLQGVF